MEDLFFQQQPIIEPVEPVIRTEPSVITSDNARKKVQQSMTQLQQILSQLAGKSTNI